MQRIWKDLADPSWWFTGFFIAIIASLLAAYVRDAIAVLPSLASKTYKSWQEKRRIREVGEIERISDDPALLIISFGEILYTLLELVFCATVFLFISVLSKQSDLLALVRAESYEPPDEFIPLWIAALIIGPPTFYFAYLLGIRFKKYKRAYKRYLEKQQESATHY